MATNKSKALSLRESSRILRPVPLEHLTVPDSWNALIKEFEDAASDGATGLVVINGAQGAGKSSFMKLLQRAMTKHANIHVVFGSVAEAISSPGWLMPFLSDILGGTHPQPLSSRAVLDRLQELTRGGGHIVLLIDGADHISTDALAADLAGLMGLVDQTSLPMLITLNAHESAASALKATSVLSHKNTMMRALPRFTEGELRDILQTRLEEAQLDSTILKTKIQTVLSQAQGIPARALRALIEIATDTEAAQYVGPASKTKSVSEPKPKKTKAGKSDLEVEESADKPSVQGKRENKTRQTSYDDLLTIKKLGS